MNYLEKIGFTSDDINVIKSTTTNVIYNLLNEQKKVVTANINYLKEIGVSNFKDIFIKFPDLFLTDHSSFTETFEKYDHEDLISKLENNIDIFAYL